MSLAGGEPYFSIVVTARNDDHGGNLLGRMQAFAGGWLAQAARFRIPSELIFVEWNPLSDRPRLREALRWPAARGPCDVRFIEVPNEVHRRFAHSEALPLYQMIAKNVGIRRAKGRFILATNIDILFSSELAEFIAQGRLETGAMYRIDRHDVMSEVPVERPIEEQLAWCRSHLLRINAREGSFPVTPEGRRTLARDDIAPPGQGILFGRGWYAIEKYVRQEPFRWAGPRAEILLGDAEGRSAALDLELEPGPGTGGQPARIEVSDDKGNRLAAFSLAVRSRLTVPLPAPAPRRVLLETRNGGAATPGDPRELNFRVFQAGYRPGTRAASLTLRPIGLMARVNTMLGMIDHAAERLSTGGDRVELTVPVSERMRRLFRRYLKVRRVNEPESAPPAPGEPPLPPLFLHTNGCGDFTLLAREHWFDLRGYPEFDLFSMNIDSLFCVAAHHGGAPEVILEDPMRIYHIEHATGSGWTPEGQSRLFQRLAAAGIPWLDNQDVLRWAAQMNRLKSPFIFNHEDWGMAALDLRETRVE
jgi:hypothetical protein